MNQNTCVFFPGGVVKLTGLFAYALCAAVERAFYRLFAGAFIMPERNYIGNVVVIEVLAVNSHNFIFINKYSFYQGEGAPLVRLHYLNYG